jgi:HEAT repeat protein
MQQLLIWTILSISAVFITLTLLIIVNKAWREARTARISRRRRDLEPKVLSWAHGDERSLRAALGGHVGGFDTAVLEEILLDHIQRVRGIERERLARGVEQLGLIDDYLAGLKKRRWWCRAEAAERLGLTASKRAIQPLSEALDDQMPEVRLRAAKALGQLGGIASARKLVRALDQPTRWSQIRVADILIGMGHESLEALLESYATLTIDGRIAVLDIVGRIRPVSLIPWLLEELTNSNADIRARAAHALGSIGDPNVSSELIKALDDPEWPVRAMAAKALGRTRSNESIKALTSSLRDKQWWVRHNSARALQALGSEGLKALESLIADGDRYAREQAILMLEEAGLVDERAAELVSEKGEDRRAARTFFERVIAAGTISRLRLLSREHPVDAVRRELLALLPSETTS